MMKAYLVTRTGVETLDTVVFSAGPSENEEAVAVFTDPTSAEAYIAQAGWSAEHTVATLEPVPFLRWLLQAHEEGVHHIVIDPDYAEQQKGERLQTISIKEQLQEAGTRIVEFARAHN